MTAISIPTASTDPDDFRFPDPPEPTPYTTNFPYLACNGNLHFLWHHFGNHDTTLVVGERYLSPTPTADIADLHYPDLLIAFGVNPDAYHRHKAYIISEQGKPPDFVMEIASRSPTASDDTGPKRRDYAALGIPEYWRFDETGDYHGARLAGDRLVGGKYQPIPIDAPDDGILQGYSAVLNLNIRWANGGLEWHDPKTGRHIVTFNDVRKLTDSDRERHRFYVERTARWQAEARIRELEAELQRIDTTK